MSSERTALSKLLNRCERKWSRQHQPIHGEVVERRRKVVRELRRGGIKTSAGLVRALPTLRGKRLSDALELISVLKIRRAIPTLLKLLQRPDLRSLVASTLCFPDDSREIADYLTQIGRRELARAQPDRSWLSVVINVSMGVDDKRVADILLTIFERTDLPGWLRGDAADRLPGQPTMDQQGSPFYQRCRTTALQGLQDEDLDLRFWSMYVIGQLASSAHWVGRRPDPKLQAALPRLREIAATDQRLAPGFWWPLSAEAEDVIVCLESGEMPEIAAAHRWQGNPERGLMHWA